MPELPASNTPWPNALQKFGQSLRRNLNGGNQIGRAARPCIQVLHRPQTPLERPAGRLATPDSAGQNLQHPQHSTCISKVERLGDQRLHQPPAPPSGTGRQGTTAYQATAPLATPSASQSLRLSMYPPNRSPAKTEGNTHCWSVVGQ